MFNLIKNKIGNKRERIVRVIILYNQGDSIGTGFFISPVDVLTCFHVVWGLELRNIRNNPEYQRRQEGDEHTKLEGFLNQKLSKIEIELPDGRKEQCSLKIFDEIHDIAILSVNDSKSKHKFFKLDYNSSISYGDEVMFCGFPTAVGYRADQTPFALTAGVVSTFVETQVGGDNYEHIQINGVNLEGNSGAPLFKKYSNKAIGIINGNMNRGNDNLAAYGENNNLTRVSFRIPLGITYATSVKLLRESGTLN